MKVLKHYESCYKLNFTEGGVRVVFEPRVSGSYLLTSDEAIQGAVEGSYYWAMGQVWLAAEEVLEAEEVDATELFIEEVDAAEVSIEEVASEGVGSVSLRFLEEVTNVSLAKEWLAGEGVDVKGLKGKDKVLEAGVRMGVQFNLK